MCCEITYSPDDKYDYGMKKSYLIMLKTICQPRFMLDQITDFKVIKLPEVYPMYIKGYQAALAETREKFDKILNLYTLGSLAEFIYADLQILFSKAIDLAQIISDKTFKINSIDKTNPRLDFNQKLILKIKLLV